MNRFRFSIGSFLVVVTLAAAGLAAMASQSPLAASGALTLILMLLCLALAGAMIPTAPQRIFCIGFAIFGWTYWFIEFDANVPRNQPQPNSGLFVLSGLVAGPSSPQRTGLITHALIDFVEKHVTPGRSLGSKVMAQWRGGTYYSGTITESKDGEYLITWDDNSAPQWTPSHQMLPQSPSLRVAAHSTLCGLFALLGGVLVALLFGGQRLATTAKPEAAETN